jgi:hypothetical protein
MLVYQCQHHLQCHHQHTNITSISTFLYQHHVHFLFPLLALTIGPEPKDTTKYQIPKNPDTRETSRPLLFAAERFRHSRKTRTLTLT